MGLTHEKFGVGTGPKIRNLLKGIVVCALQKCCCSSSGSLLFFFQYCPFSPCIASISHFLTVAVKCSCFSYNEIRLLFFFFLFALLNPIITILNTAYTAYIIYNIHTILTILTILIAYIANNTTVFKHYYISYASSTQLHRKKLI